MFAIQTRFKCPRQRTYEISRWPADHRIALILAICCASLLVLITPQPALSQEHLDNAAPAEEARSATEPQVVAEAGIENNTTDNASAEAVDEADEDEDEDEYDEDEYDEDEELRIKQYKAARREADVLSRIKNDDFEEQTVEDSASEKAIAVIEPRPFTKAGRGEIAVGIGTIASDIFVAYLPVSVRGGYHFKEWVSLELTASFMGCFSDEVGDNLKRGGSEKCMRFMTPAYDHVNENAEQTQLRSITIEQYQAARFVLNPIFSPFSGKFSLMNDAIVHYDFNVTAGLGVQVVETLDKNNVGSVKYGASFEGNFGLGLRFVFIDFVGLRLDFREYLYEKKRDSSLGTASEFGLSVSFLL